MGRLSGTSLALVNSPAPDVEEWRCPRSASSRALASSSVLSRWFTSLRHSSVHVWLGYGPGDHGRAALARGIKSQVAPVRRQRRHLVVLAGGPARAKPELAADEDLSSEEGEQGAKGVG